MKLGTDNRRQRVLAVALGVCALAAVIFLYEELFGGGAPPATPPVAVNAPVASPSNAVAAGGTAGPTARTVGTTSAGLDPTLHMEAMLVSESVVYSGGGRSIFSADSAPTVVIPVPIKSARLTAPGHVVPCPPNCPPPVIPPLPPIDLKFFGTETGPNGIRQAFLLHDETVVLASAGDTVLRRYRVIAIDAKTIQVEDMMNNNKQTLPLLVN